MRKVLLLGAGKIGRMIARFLVASNDYDLLVGDADSYCLQRLRTQTDVETVQIDAGDASELAAALRGRDAVISALSYVNNPTVAQAALEAGASYFDLTEDIKTTQRVKQIAKSARAGQIFMPQCGLAPGFVSIVAQQLTEAFELLDTVYMRVGALPQFPSNALMYNLTWSTDGLINEYCNMCEAIHDGHRMNVLPLEGIENFTLDGVRYEAFNTSGGLGTLCDTFENRVRELNYKTIRYQGHRELMTFLVNELRLCERREILKDILENAIPVTFQDVVVIFCTASGRRKGQLVQISDARKIYGHTLDGEAWSAIQITTASGVCAVLDLFCEGRLTGTGLVRQEQVGLNDFLNNRFGQHYRGSKIYSRFSGVSDTSGVGHEERTE
ncbi:MAG: saccharopine dehydrogenase NADP-binding domain-containing protein [Planctomycetia bacterium]|nr:saccharopine dehydrogenase NADP-binding domain-containing protein [Planctomycetia bacterium]